MSHRVVIVMTCHSNVAVSRRDTLAKTGDLNRRDKLCNEGCLLT